MADRGLFEERTRLAWQRTTLSGLVCLLVVIRLLVEIAAWSAVAVGAVAVLALATPVWSAARGRRHRTGSVDGRRLLVLTSMVGVTSLAALVYAAAG